MTTQTVTAAVAKRDAGAAELVRQSRGWFATIVPSHIDAKAFVALTLGYLRRQPKLAAAAQRNPQSFMAALSECARLGLVPGDTFHCVPFEDRRNNTVEITGITDYTGEIELIYRAGAVASVKAEIVYAKDQFRFTTDMDRPEHAPDWFADRGPLIGAYAYAVMKDGATSKVVVMNKTEIDKVKAVSKTSGRDDSPWNQWYDRMALKTVIHRLEKFVPTSAEYRREQLRAAAEIAQQVNTAPAAAVVDAEAGDIHDAEIIDDTPAPVTEPPPRPRSRKPHVDRGEQGINFPTAQHIAMEFKRLGIDDRSERLTYTALMAGVPDGTNLASTADLSEDTQERILADLKACADIGQLRALVDRGDAPAGGDN